jgi:serine phosphatase RsbU (regulator of sigma subunit)
MIINVWYIVLAAITILSLAMCVYYKFTEHARINKAVSREKERNIHEIRDLHETLKRFEYLKDVIEKETRLLGQDNSAPMGEDLSSSADIVMEQKKLQAEKDEMAQRNRKLWDLSVQIQKEKQRVQLLKNEIEVKHKNITDSIVYAKRIQDAVLPKVDVLAESFSDYFLFWRPKETVSGDFYWHKRQNDIIVFAVADCTGHGVPGAFMSMMGVTFLNEICANISDSTMPSDILELLRQLVITTLKQSNSNPLEPKDGMDIALCVLNLSNGLLRFSGANNPLYQVRNCELQEFRAVKNPIGLYPRFKDFETIEVQTAPGDYYYMFSDGFADQFSANTGKKVTYGRFKALLTEINKETNVGEQQKKRLGEFIDDWRGGFSQMDDILIGGFRI